MANLNKRFEVNEFSDVFLIFYSIWIYSYNNNFSTKKSYLDNQFKLMESEKSSINVWELRAQL